MLALHRDVFADGILQGKMASFTSAPDDGDRRRVRDLRGCEEAAVTDVVGRALRVPLVHAQRVGHVGFEVAVLDVQHGVGVGDERRHRERLRHRVAQRGRIRHGQVVALLLFVEIRVAGAERLRRTSGIRCGSRRRPASCRSRCC